MVAGRELEQTVCVFTDTVGTGLTVAITSVLGPSQPAALVQETQNDVVDPIEGVTKGEPVPIDEPPLAAAYHLYVPVQPEADILTVPVPQRALGPATGAPGIGLIVAITSVLGPSQPAALVQDTQYEVVELMDGVTNGEPVPTWLPFVAASYHFKVPVQLEAVKLTVPVPQRALGPAVGATGTGLMVILNG